MRGDVPADVIQTYLETVFEGFVLKLAAGEPSKRLEAMLTVVEQSVRDGSHTDDGELDKAV